ncbi:MAG: hypothetical protein ACOYN0_11865, partial [Phycisphaerales bacterium]
TLPEVVPGRWMSIVQRSLEVSVRESTLTAIRHLHSKAEVARLKRHAAVEVRVISIPAEWVPPVKGEFKRETMNALADLGARMGADPASWSTEIPKY